MLAKKRPHLLYGTLEYQSVSHGKIWTLPALSGQYFQLYNPLDGAVSVEKDKQLLKLFVKNLHPLMVQLQSQSYEGDTDDAGMPHGFGRMNEQDYTVYEGFFQHGKRHGLGKAMYANGVIFEGEFEDDKRNGAGEEWWPNGKLKYKGMYEDGARKGLGILYSEDGCVVHEGEFPEPQAGGRFGAEIAPMETIEEDDDGCVSMTVTKSIYERYGGFRAMNQSPTSSNSLRIASKTSVQRAGEVNCGGK